MRGVADYEALLQDELDKLSKVHGNAPNSWPQRKVAYDKIKRDLPLHVRRLLKEGIPEGEDRSEALFALGKDLMRAGATRKEAGSIIWPIPGNKYRDRSDGMLRLWLSLGDGAEELKEEKAAKRELYTRDKPELLDSFLHRDIPKPRWLVEGVLPAESVIYVVARAKAYKSTLVTDLALSLVSGKPFFDRFPVLEDACVLMIQEENPDSLQQVRMRAMCVAKGVSTGSATMNGGGTVDLETTPLHLWNGPGINLLDPEDRAEVEKWVKKTECDVLILDPLYIMCAGADITRPDVAVNLARWFNHLKREFGITVVVVHHNRKMPEDPPEYVPELMFGSSYLWNGADGGLFLFAKHVDEDGRPKDVLCHRHYRAWSQPPYRFSIFLEEDGSEYIVEVNERQKPKHPVVSYVYENPGLSIKEIAELKNLSESTVKKAADKYGLVKKRETPAGGGRPRTLLYPPH